MLQRTGVVMTNNEMFKLILQLTGVGKNKVLTERIFHLGGIDHVSQSKIKAWRTDIDNPRSSHMPDEVLRGFIKGFMVYRDQQEDNGIQVFNIPLKLDKYNNV